MKIYVDIDNTICTTNNSEYLNSKPIHSRIQLINKLYDEGHYIVYWTARGVRSKKDWSMLTIKQLKEWNCKYHDIVFNKPDYDLFIDDKSINSNEYFK